MKIIVQKYGGTSVGSIEKQQIATNIKIKNQIVVTSVMVGEIDRLAYKFIIQDTK